MVFDASVLCIYDNILYQTRHYKISQYTYACLSIWTNKQTTQAKHKKWMKVLTWPCYGFSYNLKFYKFLHKFIENLTCLYMTMTMTILYHWLLYFLVVSFLIKFKMPTNQPCIATKTNYFLLSNLFPQQPT